MENLQTRIRSAQPTIRENRRLTFYAAVFNEETTVHDIGPAGVKMDYREIIRPGAFNDSLRTDREVIANVDHDQSRTFAKKTTGELLIQEDPTGLFASCYLPKSDLGDKIIRDVGAGNLSASSFRFGTIRDRWTDGTPPLCELLSVSLADVCLTDNPAYVQTYGEVHLRTADLYKDFFRRLRIIRLKM